LRGGVRRGPRRGHGRRAAGARARQGAAAGCRGGVPRATVARRRRARPPRPRADRDGTGQSDRPRRKGGPVSELSDEDAKLVGRARGAMARADAAGGAAVRDGDGRTYAAAPVRLSALHLTALQAAVAAAISSGATTFEAAVLVGGGADDAGVAAVREL